VPLDDEVLDHLLTLIQDSFRVRPNHDPIYVDVGGHLDRIAAPQHQVVFGRRGSGKSCLLVHFHRTVAPAKGIRSIYIDCDEVKQLGYPDLLIRLLLMIFEKMQKPQRKWWQRGRKAPSATVQTSVAELRQLLRLADDARIIEQSGKTRISHIRAGFKGANLAKISGAVTAEASSARESSFRQRKLETLERHFSDYKQALIDAIGVDGHQCVELDDFYLIHPSVQPDVIDYVHRLLRGTNLYFKVGTVRHRTSLSRKKGQQIGINAYQDIEEINLDRTFEDTAATQEYLESMLNSMGQSVGIESASHEYLSDDARLQLALASGGVPRDYLYIFVEAVRIARTSLNKRWLTPKQVYKGAARISYRTKLSELRSDVGADAGSLEPVFQDLISFCIREKQKTAFLIAQTQVVDHAQEHELIQQLMDFKLIHIIEPDTSAASGRLGRFEAYTLDFSLFMEPRLRNIDHVRFWKVDNQRRREGLREAPDYDLDRAHSIAIAAGTSASSEQVVEAIAADVGTFDSEEEDEIEGECP